MSLKKMKLTLIYLYKHKYNLNAKISFWIEHITWSWGFKTSRSWMWSLWDINKYYFIDNYDRTITLYKIDFTLSISFRNWNCLKLPKTDYIVHDQNGLYLNKSDTKTRLITLTYCSCTPLCKVFNTMIIIWKDEFRWLFLFDCVT
jgi:hypothetical protein